MATDSSVLGCHFQCESNDDCCPVLNGKHDCTAQATSFSLVCAQGGHCVSACSSDDQCKKAGASLPHADKRVCAKAAADLPANCETQCESDSDCCDPNANPADLFCILLGPPLFDFPHCDANHRCQTTSCPSDAWCKEANKASTRAKDFICY